MFIPSISNPFSSFENQNVSIIRYISILIGELGQYLFGKTTQLIHLFTRHPFSLQRPKRSICMILISLRGYNEGLTLDVKSPTKGG
jgi:hypothetical protein